MHNSWKSIHRYYLVEYHRQTQILPIQVWAVFRTSWRSTASETVLPWKDIMVSSIWLAQCAYLAFAFAAQHMIIHYNPCILFKTLQIAIECLLCL